MHYKSILLALAGLSSIASAAPTDRLVGRAVDGIAAARRSLSKRAAVIIQQTVIQPSVTIVQENLGLINQLALTVEQEFAALVQSQLALIQEVETIKNNIRVNHFLARFSQVNTVIVCVTQVVDLRGGKTNNRYMVNQLLADNKAQSSIVVMVSAASPMTIGAVASPSLDLSGASGGAAASIVSSAAAAATDAAAAGAVGAAGNASAAASGNSSNPNIAAFDPNNPFGQIGQSVILPYGSKAPSLPNGAQIVSDPAAIILPGQALLVEDVNQFNQDCAAVVQSGLSALFNSLQATLVVQVSQIASFQVGGLVLGTASSLNNAAAALLGGGSSSGSGSVANVGSSNATDAAATAASSAAASTATVAAPAATSTAPAADAAASAAATTAAAASSAATSIDAATVTPDATANGVEPAPAAASGNGVGVQVVSPPAA